MKSIEEQLDKLYSSNLKPIEEGKKAPEFLYGEISRNGAEEIIKRFSPFFEKGGTFYDLGSGYGRLLTHIALRTDMDRVCGIELDEERATWARNSLQNFNFPSTKPEVIIGDMFKQDLSDAAIVYFDNTIYPERVYEVIKILPSRCLLIYKAHGNATGDRFFRLETTYNSRSGRPKLSPLAEWWYNRASWRVIY